MPQPKENEDIYRPVLQPPPPPKAVPIYPVYRGQPNVTPKDLPAYAPANPYVPPTSTPPTSGGGMPVSSPPTAPATNPLTWSNKYGLPGAPEWWKGMMPSQWTPETEVAAMANALIPYLSAEDQRQMGSTLSRLYPDAFGSYSPEQTKYGTTPDLTTEVSHYFQSKKRAGDVLSALDKIKEASGQDESKMGPGYQYLRQLAKTMQDFGADEDDYRMSRRQIKSLYGALDPLLSEAKGEKLGAYGEIARGLAQPFFTAAGFMGVKKDASGNWIFGDPNKNWY